MNKRTRAHNKEHFNDLLLPILAVLCIMPFIIRLAEYDYGYSHYLWHSDNSIAFDFYSYYRNGFFLFVSVIVALILIAYMTFYKEKIKVSSFCLPLLVYAAGVILSTVCSVNPEASLKGNLYQFESVFVLISYLLLFFYTYQIVRTEKDYKTLFRGLLFTFVILSVTGIFQLFEHDLLDFNFIQKLVMSPEQYQLYQNQIETIFTSNNVFLTLFNPNYAGVFLTMSTSIFLVMTITETATRTRYIYLAFTLVSFILMWFTYSRSTLIALSTGVIALLIIIKRTHLCSFLKKGIPIVLCLLILLVIADGCNNFKYISRLVDTGSSSKINSIITDKDGVTIHYDTDTYTLCMEDDTLAVYDSNRNLYASSSFGEELIIPFSSPARCTLIPDGTKSYINLLLEDTTFLFTKEQDSYYYYNENGKNDILTDIPHADFHNLEHLGSGRLYIWSRTLPLLKDYLFLGSGPETFAEVFPQNDYIGKIKYAGSSTRIVEKAHNDFLMKWVQTGLVSLIALLIFYFFFLKKNIQYYSNTTITSFAQRFGLGCFIACICYLTGCLFNDSTLFTTPFFWVFAGIALAGTTPCDKRDA